MADAVQTREIAPAPSALDYAPPAATVRLFDGFALTTHLAGWMLALLLLTGMSPFVMPIFKRLFADFNAGLPGATQLLIFISDQVGRQSLFVLGPLCGFHAFVAAHWYPRATPAKKLAYRLVLFLLIAFAVGFVFLALCEPLSRAMFGMSGGPSPPTPAPATSPGGG
jgi:hypothetical protein